MGSLRAAVVFPLLGILALFASGAAAQSTGSIAGVVRDATGGVLPGVTVEAASPALIEKVRTAVSDGQGNYKIADLRPGVYAVTFTLPGFSTVRREGIELSANFTANVSVDLRVGSVEETVVVTGASPIVDVQNVSQQSVINRTIIDSLPTNKTFQGLAAYIPGVVQSNQDVGGSNTSAFGGINLSVHGSKTDEMPMMLDGLKLNNMHRSGGGSSMLYRINSAMAEEITIETSGMGAEYSDGGMLVNTVPREGGNVYHGTFFGNYTDHNLESSNLTDRLRGRGISSTASTRRRYEVNFATGGPVQQDRIWFFAGVRHDRSIDRQPNIFHAVDPRAVLYTPDLNQPFEVDGHFVSMAARVTFQAATKHKFSAFYDRQPGCICPLILGFGSPESGGKVKFTGNYLAQGTWKAPMTNRLLFDAAIGVSQQSEYYQQFDELGPRYTIMELATGFSYHGPGPVPATTELGRTWSGRAAMSYVTGSHAIKLGSQWVYGFIIDEFDVFDNKQLRFFNGVPNSVAVWTTPYSFDLRTAPNLGAYAQDQWNIGRVTLSGGLRFEYVHAYTPPYRQDPVQYVGIRDFSKVDNVPNWKDIVPRFGAAWDVFGNGKTAIKGSMGKYVVGMTGGLARSVHPVNTSVNSTTRSWVDANRDFIPQESELGPLANANFGRTVITSRFDPDFTEGWGKRSHTWEGTISVQQELRPSVGVTAAYVRRSRGNFVVTDNLAVSPSDYDRVCINAPIDSRLPEGGGYQVCDYNINPLRFGQVNNLITLASNYGDQSEIFNGIDISFNARLAKGFQLHGGTSTGRLTTNNCDLVGKVDNGARGSSGVLGDILAFDNPAPVASPNNLYCEVVPPFLTQFKMSGLYALPWWGVQVSGGLQSLPGPAITATYNAPNALVAPSLGRNLAGGFTTTRVELIAPNSVFGDRLNQIDIRLTKNFAVRGARLQAQMDLYNLLNADTILRQNNVFGAAWQRPTAILPPRIVKFGVQLDY